MIGLFFDYVVSNLLEINVLDISVLYCIGCKSKEINVVVRCFDCVNFLCVNCVMVY